MATAMDQPGRVLLIHGTGAGKPVSSGDDWWQRGSDFWKNLNERLHPKAACWPPDEQKHVFRWGTGPNRETRRLKAGRELLEEWLLPLEHENQPYHLVGHSHGGSVIWHALLDATRRGVELKCLRTWTTLGTPFLHYRAERLGLWELLAAPLAAPVFAWLAWLAYTDLPYNWRSIWERSGLWLFVLVAGLLLGYSLYRLFIVLLAWRRCKWGAKWAGRTFERYGSRWLGLYSELDEAKNGLRATLNRTDRIIPRIPSWSESIVPSSVPLPLGWLYNLVSLPYYFLARPFYNRWIAPEIDSFINKRLTNTFQGNDRSGYALLGVHSAPILTTSAHKIAPELEKAMRDEADVGLAKLLSGARERLGVLPSDSSTLQQFLAEVIDFKGTELIHTSYYRAGGVRGQLATHITHGVSPGPVEPHPEAARLNKILHRFPVDTDWRRLYFSGLLFLLLPLGLWLLAPVPWYLRQSEKQYAQLQEPIMRSNHPMLEAIHQDDVRALRYYLDDKGANQEAMTPFENGLFAEAIYYGKRNTIRYLYNREFPMSGKLKLPPLHFAANAGAYEEAVFLMMELDAKPEHTNPSKTNENGKDETPLHWAARTGEMKLVELLLERKADPQARDMEGLTPGDWARNARESDAFKKNPDLLAKLESLLPPGDLPMEGLARYNPHETTPIRLAEANGRNPTYAERR